jgi:hypothetical protein
MALLTDYSTGKTYDPVQNQELAIRLVDKKARIPMKLNIADHNFGVLFRPTAYVSWYTCRRKVDIDPHLKWILYIKTRRTLEKFIPMTRGVSGNSLNTETPLGNNFAVAKPCDGAR